MGKAGRLVTRRDYGSSLPGLSSFSSLFYGSILVVALGEHVDYWNRLGWKDIFSALVYTERQRQYVTGFGTGSYTPQAVVNGRYELMGSRTVELVANRG